VQATPDIRSVARALRACLGHASASQTLVPSPTFKRMHSNHCFLLPTMSSLRFAALALCLCVLGSVAVSGYSLTSWQDKTECSGSASASAYMSALDKCTNVDSASVKALSCDNSTGVWMLTAQHYSENGCPGTGFTMSWTADGKCHVRSDTGSNVAYIATCAASTVAFNMALVAALMVAMKVASNIMA